VSNKAQGSNGRIIYKLLIEKDLIFNCRNLNETVFQHSLGGTAKNFENLIINSRWPN
jgi:hypothetical protein